MSCLQTISDYSLRSLGYGERLLPKADITLCEQFVLIVSSIICNIYQIKYVKKIIQIQK